MAIATNAATGAANKKKGKKIKPYHAFTKSADLFVIDPSMVGYNKLQTRKDISTSGTRANAINYMSPWQYNAFTEGDLDLALPDDERVTGNKKKKKRVAEQAATPTQTEAPNKKAARAKVVVSALGAKSRRNTYARNKTALTRR